MIRCVKHGFGPRVLSLLGVAGMPTRTPAPDEIKERVREILAQNVYDLDTTSRYRLDLTWLVEKIMTPLLWLKDALSNAPPFISRVLIGALIIALAGILAYMIYTMYMAVRRKPEASLAREEPRTADVAALVRTSRRLAGSGNYVDASRVLFQGALTLLENKRGGRVMVGLTTTEYLGTFRTPCVVENLRVFVDLINWKWYRDRRFDAADYEQCCTAYATLEERLNELG